MLKKRITTPRRICWLLLLGVPALSGPSTLWRLTSSCVTVPACYATAFNSALHKRLLCRVTWSDLAIFLTINSGRRESCWPTRLFVLPLCIVIGFVFPDAKKISQAFVRERLDLFSCLNTECLSLTSVEKDGDGQRFVELKFGLEANVVLPYFIY